MEPGSLSDAPFRLRDWEVHPEDGTLRSPGVVRRLEPQLMELLVFLAGRAGEVVAKQQIFDGVWGGRIVSDDALTGAVSQLRKALGDDARSPRYIETLPKRGYRLREPPVVPVREDGSAVPPDGGERRRSTGWRRFGIVAAVVALLMAAFLVALARRPPGGAVPEGAPAAREANRRGQALLENPSAEGLEQARLDFALALRMDPKLAEAEAGLAQVYIFQAFSGAGAPAELFPRARAAALRAVALDPDLAAAHTALGAVQFLGDRDFDHAEEELRRAIRLEPDSVSAHHVLALLLSAWGRHDDAVAEVRRAVALAPANLRIRASAMEVLFFARRHDEVLRTGREILGLAPDYPQPYFQMSWAYASLGKPRQAYDTFRQGSRNLGIPEENLRRLDDTFAAEGLPGVYRSAARSLENVREVTRVNWGDLLAFYAAAGERDRVFALLENAMERGEPGLVWMRVSPFADGLRSDPRFERMARRLGLPAVPPS